MFQKSCFYLFLIVILVQTSLSIRIPGENVDKKTLTTLGIKTLDWQGGDTNASYPQVYVHHNYSKVYVQNEGVSGSSQYSQNKFSFGDGQTQEDLSQGQLSDLGQTSVDDADYLELTPLSVQGLDGNHLGTVEQSQHSQSQASYGSQHINSFGGQQQENLDSNEFSQFTDDGTNQFQIESSAQLNQGQGQFKGEDDTHSFSQKPQNLHNDQHQANYQNFGQNKSSITFGQQQVDYDDLSGSSSSNSQIYNAHGYGNLQQLDHITKTENQNQQQFVDFPDYDQQAEATNWEQQEGQVKKFYTLNKPIYVHGFKYPPNPDDVHPSNKYTEKPLPEVHTKCPKGATGQFVYALSCNQFLNCWKGRGYAQNCAPGTLFNPQTLECDFASKVTCVTGPRKPAHDQNLNSASLKLQTGCPAGFSGVVPHHSDCSKFINCANGAENVMDCPPGTLFSLKINNCDFPYKAECASWSAEFGNIKNVNTHSSKYGTTTGSSGATSGNYQTEDNFGNYGGSYYQGGHGYDQKYVSTDDFRQQQQAGGNINTHGSQGGQTNIGSGGWYGATQHGQNHGLSSGADYESQSQYVGSHGSQGQGNVGSGGWYDGTKYHGSSSTVAYESQPQRIDNQGQGIVGSGGWYGGSQHGQYHGSVSGNDYEGQSQYGANQGQGNQESGGWYGGTQNGQYYGSSSSQNAGTTSKAGSGHYGSHGSFQGSTNQYQQPTGSSNSYNQQQGTYLGGKQHTNYQQGSVSQGQGQNQDLTGSQSQYIHGSHNIYGQTQQGVVQCPEDATGLFPHPYDCSKFLNCANGQATVQGCGSGTVFNPESKVCDFPHNVNCGNSKSLNNQGLISQGQNGATHGSYQQIGGNNGNSYGGTDPNPSATQWQIGKSSASGQNSLGGSPKFQSEVVAKCPDDATGLHPHPTICSKFLNCANGQTFIQDCGPGTVFNPVSKVCDFPYNVNCGATHGEGLFDLRAVAPVTQENEESSSSTPSYDNRYHQGGSYGQGPDFYAQNTGGQTQQSHSTGSKTNQGFYGLNQHSDGAIGGHTQGQNSQKGLGQKQGVGQTSGGHTQQGFYGQGQTDTKQGFYGQNQNVGQNSGGHSQQGFYDQGHIRAQQGSYGQTQNVGQSSGGQTQQGLYGEEQTGFQQGSYGQNQNIGQTPGEQKNTGQTQEVYQGQSGTSKHNQNSHGQNLQGFSGQTHSNTGNKQHEDFYVQNINKFKPGYHAQTSDDQDIEETRYFNQQSHGSGQSQTTNFNKYNQPATRNISKPHSPPPFPSTDINADYEFGSQDVVPEPGAVKPIVLKPKPKGDRKRKDFCEPFDFHCSIDDCIPQTMVCDGIKDCSNGIDEQNCEKYLDEYMMTPNSILAVREKERFLNITLVYCAKSCLESKGFQCKSFSYRKDDGACFLSDSNVGLSGALIVSHPYNYYEVNSLTVNCTNLYKCPNQKCIKSTQVCDGINDCGDRIDEKGCSAKAFGYQIKLGGTDKKHEGRIELKAFGKWGYICDDKFGLRDAEVVCKELGFELGALEVKANSYFAQDLDDEDVFYLMDDVTCLGNETSIRDCDFNGWGVNNCEAQEVVGVVCKTPQETCPKDHWKCDTVQECLPLAFVCDGVFDCTDQSDEGSQHCEAPTELRLAGGSSKYEGRVEIRHHGIWGTVCDDDFNDDAAKVVCKYLGYPGKATSKKDGYFGPGDGPIWLDQVFCQGNETALQNCVHWNWGEHNCEHAEDVGVICSSTYDSLDIVGSERSVKLDQRQQINDILPQYLFPERCGLRKDDQFVDEDNVHFRVVKGSVANKGDYPWQASLRITSKSKSKAAHWCGAVVISPNFVLTAAHCLVGFSKGAYFVVAGDYNTDSKEGTEQEAYIDEFYVHERFRVGQKMNNDIALIKLKGEGFTFTKDIQPICLPDLDTIYEAGMNCTISGFGTAQSGVSAYSHELRAGWVPMQSKAVCQMPHVYGNAITDGMICAGSLDEGVDACDGDSGGPLACLHEGYFTLYGLTSWGQHCGHANKPGVYVKVSHYRKWIDDTIRKHS